MKISIVSTAYPFRGGIAHYVGILYRLFVAQGHEVQVITFKRQYPAFLFPGKTQMETSTAEGVVIPTEQIIDSIWPPSWFRAARRIREFEPDLVLFKYWMPFFAPCFGTIARRVKKDSAARIGFICDNIIPHERRPGDEQLTRYVLGAADFFVVQSGVVEKQLLSLFSDPVYKLIPHPVYDIFGDPLEKRVARSRLGIEEERVILFFGYVRRYKGLDLLIRALPDLLKKFDIRVLAVGEFYDDEKFYRNLVRELALDASVSIHSDFVPNEEVNQYFCATDVVVLPYRSATQSGIVQIAYHFNKPCIVTNVGGLSEVVIDGKTGFVVEPDSPESITDAISKFYEERREDAFTDNVRREKVKYSWENMTGGILELMNVQDTGDSSRESETPA